MTSKVIGEGTYGCVLKPALKCLNDNTIDYTDKVSKIMFRPDSNRKSSKYTNIINIEGLEKYAIIAPPLSCEPLLDDNFLNSVQKCKNKTIKLALKHNKQNLVMLLTHENILNYLKTSFTEQTLLKQKKFLSSLVNLFDGLLFFQEKNIIHQNIRLDNIVYNSKDGTTKYVDNDFKTHKNFSDHPAKSFDLYSLSLALLNIPSYLKKAGLELYFIRDYLLLFSQYTSPDLKIRKININELKNDYIKMLKHYKYYSNETTKMEIKDIAKEKKDIAKETKDIAKETTKKETTKKETTKKETKKKKKRCPPDKPIINLKTNRCLKECKTGFTRDVNFKCVKIKKSKKIEYCKSIDKDYNPITKRCNKKCEKGKIRDKTFKCVKNK